MKPKLGIHAKDISLNISCVFYSGRIRTLVAMTTYSSYRLVEYEVMLMTLILVINALLLNFLNRVIGIISKERLFLSFIADTMN